MKMLPYFKYLLPLFICGFLSRPVYSKQYKGAELRTHAAFTYGRFEVSLKPANRPGMLSSFFTYHEISDLSEWNEIDIEILGRYSNNVQFNTITGGQVNHASSRYTGFNPFTDFHTYAIEWTPDYVAWFIDGEEVYRQTGEHITSLNRPQKLMMNIWNPEYPGWVGDWDDSYLPAFAYYDWVSYSSYTPGSGTTGSGNNFTNLWRDDFNSYDSGRWGKGTHTWSGNGCDFVPENVVFRDGLMILCLTKEGETGYTDTRPPKVIWARENYRNQVLVRFSEETDPNTAEQISNYIIPGVVVTGVTVSEDRKTVTLSTEGYKPDISYNVLVQNVSDDWEQPNVMQLSAVTVAQIDTLQFPVKINLGGDQFEEYLPDGEWDNAAEYGYLDGSETRFPGNLQIAGTDEPQVYRSERRGLKEYKIRVPNGLYNVKLLFSESYFESAGKRIFDLYVEDEQITNDLDIFARAGKFTAHVVESEIEISDETIDIYFCDEVDNALINGIIIEQKSTGVESRKENLRNFELYPGYPNPFNGTARIKFYMDKAGEVRMNVYNLLGEKVFETTKDFPSGENTYRWNASSRGRINSGVYFFTVTAGGSSKTTKLIYIK